MKAAGRMIGAASMWLLYPMRTNDSGELQSVLNTFLTSLPCLAGMSNAKQAGTLQTCQPAALPKAAAAKRKLAQMQCAQRFLAA
jgi:hypothetical protein